MKKGLKLGAVAAVLFGAMSSQSYALDCDGSSTCAIGTQSSTGKFDITFFNETEIKLFGLEDITLFNDTDPSSGDKTGTSKVCVASNVPNYNVTLTSNQSFELSGGSGTTDTIAYSLVFDDGSTQGTWDTAAGNDKTVGGFLRTNTSTSDTTCVDGTDITVTLADAAYASAATGVYTDTVTVTVAPE